MLNKKLFISDEKIVNLKKDVIFMGMFDTIEFRKPIACVKCGMLIENTQTKQFENLMITYEPGDILPRRLITGVIKETLFCQHNDPENRMKFSFDQEAFIAIWRAISILEFMKH